MSGGKFCGNSYPYYQVAQFADELEHLIGANEQKNEYGYCPGFSPKTLAFLSTQVEPLRRTAEAMRAIDYLYSGDHGEASFFAAIEKIQGQSDGPHED